MEIAPRIVARVIGPNTIRIVPSLKTEACLAVVDGRYRVVLREIGRDSNFAIAHELAHWAMRELAHTVPDGNEERQANYLGAAILAPPRAVTSAHRFYGEKPRALADAFGLSQTSTILRLGEVRHDERAVMTRNGHRLLRSEGRFAWETVELRGVTHVAGLTRARLRGGIDEGRIAWRASK